MLVVENLRKHFGGVKAVDDVSFTVDPESILGIIGPNGSGKSTLVALLMGNTKSAAGRVCLEGVDISSFPPHRRVHNGLARTFQETRLFEGMLARENVLFSASEHDSNVATAATSAEECLDFVGLSDVADVPVDELTHLQQRLLMIATALASKPKLILLDEPAVGTAGDELSRMIETIERIPHERKCGVMLIDHNMRLVMSVCSRILALDFGKILADGDPDTVRNDPRVIEAYFGTEDTDE